MRVAYICADPGVSVFGCTGASVRAQEIIRAMVRRGIHVALFAVRLGGKMPPDLREVVRLHRLPPIPKGDQTSRKRAVCAANDALRLMLERAGPFDFVYERYSPGSDAGMMYARAAGIPGLLEVDAPSVENLAGSEGFHRAEAQEITDRALSAATALLAVSEEVATSLESHPAARGRVHLLLGGVDAHRFRPGLVPAFPTEPGKLTIGFAGVLNDAHALAMLADAFAALHRNVPGTRLLIVGDGPRREELVTRLASDGLQDVVYFAGVVDPQEMPAWVASMDVGVVPYANQQTRCSSPLKVFEYMAAGVPVVAGRVGQLARLIEDDVNGILVPPGDAVALADALERLCIDPDLRARLGPAGRMTVLHRYTWDAIVQRVLSLGRADPATPPALRVADRASGAPVPRFLRASTSPQLER